MKPTVNGVGYEVLNLTVAGKHLMRYVHRLVASAFIRCPQEASEIVNHIDGNKLNNASENLEWTNHAGNGRHAVRTGLKKMVPFRGEHNGMAKATSQQVLMARALYDSGKSLKSVAESTGLSYSITFKVCRRLSWKHL